jgi:hypothetical protein
MHDAEIHSPTHGFSDEGHWVARTFTSAISSATNNPLAARNVKVTAASPVRAGKPVMFSPSAP